MRTLACTVPFCLALATASACLANEPPPPEHVDQIEFELARALLDSEPETGRAR